MICPKCKNENQEGSIFCNKCGTKFQAKYNETDIIQNAKPQEELISDIKDNIAEDKKSRITNKLKSIIKNKKVLIPASIVCCLLVITYLAIKPPSTDEVFNKVKYYDNEKAFAYLEEVYPTDGGFLGLFKKKNVDYKTTVLNLMIENLENKFKKDYGMDINGYSKSATSTNYNSVKISKVDIEYPKYSSDYVDINVTVTNNGETSVNYVKVNLYFKDSNGQIIKSDWTNDSSVIKPGANQVITKMEEKGDWESVSAEIAEVR